MEVNFFKDLETEIKEKLKDFGYPIPSFTQLRKQDKRPDEVDKNHELYDVTNLLIHYLTVVQRRIPIKKWNIHISPKLQNRPEIQELKTKLSSGDDVNEYLSKQVKEKNQKKTADRLLYEWGIFHIHFERGGKGDDMLFVYFDENDAYFIDILQHEKENITWTRSDLVQILHDNWPQALSMHVFNNGLDGKDSTLPRIITDEERRNLRNKNGGAHVIVNDGTVYKKMGGGITPSGAPYIAVNDSTAMIKDIKKLQYDILENKQTICDFVGIQHPKLRLKLSCDLEIRIIEEITNTKMT